MPVATHSNETLPRVARYVDTELVQLDRQVDWLYYLSPLDNDRMWSEFRESGYRAEPRLHYRDLPDGIGDLRRPLHELPFDDVEIPLVRALLLEKQREIERQLDLLLLRETEGFLAVSIDLFGNVEPPLLESAEDILRTVHPEATTEELSCTCADVVKAANAELDEYRMQAPDLASQVQEMDDLNSMMMVHFGDFQIAKSARLSPHRLAPLVAHEIGTHVVTHYNGQHQPLKQLQVGLAHYDALQEGLAVLAEFLAGYFPPRRLRVIAARVIAADLIVERCSIVDVFSQLYEEYGLPKEDAFDTAVRARRGGGLTKDSVYLRGLRDLLGYLAADGDLSFLYLGKFALQHETTLRELMDRGWVKPPALLPNHLSSPDSLALLERARQLPLNALWQKEPAS